ncbi:glycosyltransferase [Serratia microhaemolytica]|uniref:glycosyltransferase n=1 Tax=Serratia microhaemolytica TaxID=2675110 RepID=UPI000FDD0733|nr:glycosyltransferase family 2 protein [Serratia microhaemolytica]
MNSVKEKYRIVVSVVLYEHDYLDLQDTLASLLGENCIDKVILVDNGGSEWIHSINNAKVVCLSNGKNNGFGRGHNFAIESYLECSDFFLICNPDIKFDQGTVEKLYQFAKNEEHQFVVPKVYYNDERFQYSCRLLPTPANLFLRRFFPKWASKLNISYEMQHADYTKSFSVPSASGCFMLISSILLQELKGFDERYFMYLEDVDLCRRASLLSDIRFFPDAIITHGFQKGSYRSMKLFLYHVRSAVIYFNKWGWFFDRQRRVINKRCIRIIESRKEV